MTSTSDQTRRVEFSIEIDRAFNYGAESVLNSNEYLSKLHATITGRNGLRRTTRCWDFPSWRLHRAAMNKDELEEGEADDVDVNAKDLNGRTALHEASKAGNLDYVVYLLSRGAHIDMQDDQGTTPLLEAMRFGHVHVATLLLVEHRKREEEVARGHTMTSSHDDSSSWDDVMTLMNQVVPKTTIERRNNVIRWLILTVNVGLEFCQILVSEEEEDGRIGSKLYRDLTAGFSWICMVLSIVEFVYEVKKNRAKWTKRRGRYCFYTPGIHTQVFGSFMLWFELISSTIQFCLNTAALVVERVIVRFDYIGMLLAICLLVAAFIHKDRPDETKMVGVVKCVAHVESEAQCVLRQGVWVFQCPKCHIEKLT